MEDLLKILGIKSYPKVGVILLNWNGGEFTIPCIESLNAGKIKPDQIVVVDNASSDGSPDRIAQMFPEGKLILNKINKGFTGANNQGIALLLKEKMDYIWVLNNDTLVDSNCLFYLLQAAVRCPECSCFTGKIFYDDPPDRLWYAGGYRHRLHLAPKHVYDDSLGSGITETYFVSGCCMFITRSALIDYGGFCEEFFIYSEDNEWSWRVRHAGGKLLYVPQAVLWHRLSASMKKNTSRKGDAGISSRAYYLIIRNNLWTIRLHAFPFVKKLLALLIHVGIAIKIVAICIWSGFPDKIPLIVRGLVHGLVNPLPRHCSFGKANRLNQILKQ